VEFSHKKEDLQYQKESLDTDIKKIKKEKDYLTAKSH
jgi:hypothetical protein